MIAVVTIQWLQYSRHFASDGKDYDGKDYGGQGYGGWSHVGGRVVEGTDSEG